MACAFSVFAHMPPTIYRASFLPIAQGYISYAYSTGKDPDAVPGQTVSWLVDKKERLFVTSFLNTHFGSVSQSFMRVRLCAPDGGAMYGDVVYSDYSSGLVLIRVEEQYAHLLDQVSEGFIAGDFCQEGQPVQCVGILDFDRMMDLPMRFCYEMSEIVEPWVIGAGGVQGFTFGAKEARLAGAPILDEQARVVGITSHSQEGGFAIQGRYIRAMLERYARDPVEVYSTMRVRDRFGNVWRFNSDNAYVRVDWSAATLKSRLYFSQMKEDDLDPVYRVFKGRDKRKRHLYLHRGMGDLCTGNAPLRLGDVIWSVWVNDREIPIYGDPFLLTDSMYQVAQSGKKNVHWTVLRDGKSYKVLVPLSLSRPATKVLVCGEILFSNEGVEGYSGLCAYFQEMRLFVQHVNGVKVSSIQDVYEQIHGLDSAVMGVCSIMQSGFVERYIQLPWSPMFWEHETCLFVTFSGSKPRIFERKNGIWEMQR